MGELTSKAGKNKEEVSSLLEYPRIMDYTQKLSGSNLKGSEKDYKDLFIKIKEISSSLRCKLIINGKEYKY